MHLVYCEIAALRISGHRDINYKTKTVCKTMWKAVWMSWGPCRLSGRDRAYAGDKRFIEMPVLLQKGNVSTEQASLQGLGEVPMAFAASSHSWSRFGLFSYSRGVCQSGLLVFQRGLQLTSGLQEPSLPIRSSPALSCCFHRQSPGIPFLFF